MKLISKTHSLLIKSESDTPDIRDFKEKQNERIRQYNESRRKMRIYNIMPNLNDIIKKRRDRQLKRGIPEQG